MPTSEQIERVAEIIEQSLERHGVTAMQGTLDDARAALSAAEGVKPCVKELVWQEIETDRGDGSHEPTGDWEAVTPFTVYSVNMGFASDSYIWDVYTGEADHIGCYDDPDTAKAAAQADYEARILSALQEGGVMDGYIIANSGWPDNVALLNGCHTFGKTMQDAWLRHIGGPREDSSVIINRWVQKGYCPRPCRLEISEMGGE